VLDLSDVNDLSERLDVSSTIVFAGKYFLNHFWLFNLDPLKSAVPFRGMGLNRS
jgi:hypothetical protein